MTKISTATSLTAPQNASAIQQPIWIGHCHFWRKFDPTHEHYREGYTAEYEAWVVMRASEEAQCVDCTA